MTASAFLPFRQAAYATVSISSQNNSGSTVSELLSYSYDKVEKISASTNVRRYILRQALAAFERIFLDREPDQTTPETDRRFPQRFVLCFESERLYESFSRILLLAPWDPMDSHPDKTFELTNSQTPRLLDSAIIRRVSQIGRARRRLIILTYQQIRYHQN